jgi:hypothetical protein
MTVSVTSAVHRFRKSQRAPTVNPSQLPRVYVPRSARTVIVPHTERKTTRRVLGTLSAASSCPSASNATTMKIPAAVM